MTLKGAIQCWRNGFYYPINYVAYALNIFCNLLMNKLNIFISSTCYDLSQVRADLCDFITGLGHNPIMSESIDFPVNPHISTMENCINAVREEADLLVLIIGNRYGSLLDSGKSITNTEFLTAVRKGIPVYTFTYKPLANYLPIWKSNPNADFSSVVDNVKVFEFLADVRNDKKLWNFEFEKAQDILSVLKSQLSYLFKDALAVKKQLNNANYSNLYSKVSPRALSILLQESDLYEMKFFLQSIMDEIDKYSDLRNDYEYSLKLQPSQFRIYEAQHLMDWMQLKLGLLQNYISSLNNLFKAYRHFYGAPGVPADLEGLAYVARAFAKLYSYILSWVIEVRSAVVCEDFVTLLTVFSEIPNNVIRELEEFPRDTFARVEDLEEKLQLGMINPGETIDLPLDITLDSKVMAHYEKELNALTMKCMCQG